MAWRTMEVAEQGMRFVVAASRGKREMRALCAEFGISRPTGDLWLERYRAGGVAGVSERSRRPRSSPGRTEAAVGQRIVALRGSGPPGANPSLRGGSGADACVRRRHTCLGDVLG